MLHCDGHAVVACTVLAPACHIVIEQQGVPDLAIALFESILEVRESKAIFVVCNQGSLACPKHNNTNTHADDDSTSTYVTCLHQYLARNHRSYTFALWAEDWLNRWSTIEVKASPTAC